MPKKSTKIATVMTPPPPPTPTPAPASNRASRREVELCERERGKLQAKFGADATAEVVEDALLAWERKRKRLVDKRKSKLIERKANLGIKKKDSSIEKNKKKNKE
ncbi:hypothetical protein MCOR25_001891 [Pyricularia grisea]|uniref:Uncharacterized protein n=1 Tax=Pyricularia grisea TaxID=148305 RepID=A0A6P8BHL0_PYRGI|nr:uncharacterized protein PgNI_01968 [Pyricularia grisea]KAI6379760.1 hypothetical protein MCOR25_001891 [Pyricularia grisea]TLD16258.1 hypothetical protein PgNI_01968 [Pyricularia grisea]